MKKILLSVSVLLLLCFIKQARAQDADQPIHIAIIPFTSTGITDSRRDVTEAVENQVSSCFANKGRFFLIDRGVTEQLKRELDAAKDNSSVYAKVVAEQGHLAGAEYIITAVVSPVSIETGSSTYSGTTTYTYTASLHVALQMDKVETGRVFYSNPIIIQSVGSLSESSAVDNALCKFGSQMKAIVRNLFSPPMMIISVEKEKKGLPEQVRVNAGTEMFDSGKDNACGSVLTSIFFGKKKIILEVFVEQDIVAAGRTYKNQHVIGSLKVTTVEGETSICDVSNGADQIKGLMDKGTMPLVRMPVSN